MISLHASELAFDAGARCLFRNVNLQIESGESVALMGESGVGKSTLVRAFLGQLAPGITHSGGTILVDGQNPLRLSARALRALRWRCAYVDQDPGACLPPRHSVRKIIASRALLDDAAMLELLGDFGLGGIPDLLERRPQELSGGQRRRVGVAAGVAANPELLIIDEPTAGVDAPTIELMLDALRTAQQRTGATTVVVTHDANVADALTQRTLVLSSAGLHVPEPAKRERIVGATPIANDEATQDASPLLVLNDLSLGHGEYTVLSGLHLDVYRGERIGISGPSGAGKTTILSAILGLVPPRAGTITLHGEPLPMLERRPQALRRQLGWIPQESELALNPYVTARALLLRTGASKSEITALLEHLELPAFLQPEARRLKPDDLSGGQRQRLNVAIALLKHPVLLLADEPTSALDAHSAGLVLSALREFCSSETSVIVVSHDERALQEMDRVVAVAH